MRIVFGILSSKNTDLAIQQIIDAIGSDHIVIIHHDFSKQPDFHVTGKNVHVIEDYAITEWGGWSLVESTIKILQYALKIEGWDYFQLLSDTCLPVRPIKEFERFIEDSDFDVNISSIPISKYPEVLLTHGFRAFSSKGTFGYRILRKVNYLSNKMRGMNGYRIFEGLTLPTYSNDNNPLVKLFACKLPILIYRLAEKGIGFKHPFHGGFECFIGSQFFGCTHSVCTQMQQWMDANNELVESFKARVTIPDEFFFLTIIGNLHLKNIGLTNHFVNIFDSHIRHVRDFELDDFDRLRQSGKFFARKFSKIPEDAMRLKMIADIGNV